MGNTALREIITIALKNTCDYALINLMSIFCSIGIIRACIMPLDHRKVVLSGTVPQKPNNNVNYYLSFYRNQWCKSFSLISYQLKRARMHAYVSWFSIFYVHIQISLLLMLFQNVLYGDAIKTRAVSDCLILPLPASVNALLVNCA